MRKWLFVSVLALAATAATGNRASAFWFYNPPYLTSAAFPCANPAGWHTNAYYYAWYYPWYAYYNYSHGPYANWAAGGGYATYGGGCGPGGCHTNGGYSGYRYGYETGAYGYFGAATGTPAEATLAISLPADAKLLFNGTAGTGTGESRTFRTAPLQPGREYAYELTAEVVRDGQVKRATERVVIRAGQETKVTLNVDAVRTAGLK